MQAGIGVLAADAVRVFWVNPVADLRVMNLLEDAGGRVCGTEYLFCHALDPIPTDLPPLEALARMALADPMVGSAVDRAERICADIGRFGAEAVVISRIPGASHCAMEAVLIGEVIQRAVGHPRGGDRSAPDHRRDGADAPHAPGGPDGDGKAASARRPRRLAGGLARRAMTCHLEDGRAMICAGVDAGSRTTKIVLLDADSREVVAAGVVDQGIEQDSLATALMERLLREKGFDRGEVATIVATGYGRKLISMAHGTITEITCQAWGVRQAMPDARTIIDIGGQDSKFLRLNGDGTVADFVMNDRCAAGTGRFLELVATRLGVRLACLGELAGRSRTPALISSMCVVFAETEIIGLLASGVAPEDIVAGVQASIATRVAAMTGRNAGDAHRAHRRRGAGARHGGRPARRPGAAALRSHRNLK